jgi:hypothetical protein
MAEQKGRCVIIGKYKRKHVEVPKNVLLNNCSTEASIVLIYVNKLPPYLPSAGLLLLET